METNLTEIIKKIRTAVFGREVRNSIADGLEYCGQISENAKADMDATAEAAKEAIDKTAEDAKNAIESNAASTKEQLSKAIDAKAAAALESIPEEYTELDGSVKQLKEDLDAYVQTINKNFENFPLNYIGIKYEYGTYASFSTGGILIKENTGNNRIRFYNPLMVSKTTYIHLAQGYLANILYVSNENKIVSSTNYISSFGVVSGSLIAIVIKRSDESDIDISMIDEILKIRYDSEKFINKNILKNGNSFSFEAGSYSRIAEGQKLVKFENSALVLTRKRLVDPVFIKKGMIINSKEGYLFNSLQISGGFIKGATGDIESYEFPDDGLYTIVVKAQGNGDISDTEINDMIYFAPQIPLTDARFITLEYGTFQSFTPNGAISKFNSAANRVRSQNEFVVPDFTRLSVPKGYLLGVLTDKGDGKLLHPVVYQHDYICINQSKIWVVIKKENDSDIDIGPELLLVEHCPNPFSKQIYWKQPNAAAVYTPIVSPDVSKFSYSANMSTVIAAWNDLANDSDGYLTVSSFGKDQSGMYDVIKVSAVGNLYTVSNNPPKPKVLLAAGVHGGEAEAVFALYYLFYDIVHNWKKNPVLEYLRWNINFEIMPLVNPWGNSGETRSYYNSRGVNINHNFSDNENRIGWGEDEGDVGHPERYGENPFSERETQYMKKFFDENIDALVYIDFHQNAGGTILNPGEFTYHDLDPYYKSQEYYKPAVAWAIQHLDWVNLHYPEIYNLDVNVSSDSIYGKVLKNTIGGHAYSYAMSVGVYGQIVECPPNLPGKYTLSDSYSADNLKAAIQTFGMWINMILCGIYGETHIVN